MRRKMLVVADEVEVGDLAHPPSWEGDSVAPVTKREDTPTGVRLTVGDPESAGATTWWTHKEEHVKVVRG